MPTKQLKSAREVIVSNRLATIFKYTQIIKPRYTRYSVFRLTCFHLSSLVSYRHLTQKSCSLAADIVIATNDYMVR